MSILTLYNVLKLLHILAAVGSLIVLVLDLVMAWRVGLPSHKAA